MSGAGGGDWYVSSCGWQEVDGDNIRLFKVTRQGEFIGIIGCRHYETATDILVAASAVDWPERPETIEEYVTRVGKE